MPPPPQKKTQKTKQTKNYTAQIKRISHFLFDVSVLAVPTSLVMIRYKYAKFQYFPIA